MLCDGCKHILSRERDREIARIYRSRQVASSVMISCACGCGTNVPSKDKRGRHRLFKNGHNSYLRIGEKNPLWKGGLTKKLGYMMVKVPDHPYGHGGYVFLHRLIMEEHLGRYLHPNEKVHHKNGDITDNRLENLQHMTQAEHLSHHRRTGDVVGGHGYGRLDKHGNRTH